MGLHVDKKRIQQDIYNKEHYVNERLGEKRGKLQSQTYIDIRKKKYKNSLFPDVVVNLEEVEDITYSGLTFDSCKFKKCGFSNVTFENCNFSFCGFFLCAFKDVYFINCDFVYGGIAFPKLTESSGRNNLVVSGLFSNSSFTNVLFDNCKMDFLGFINNSFTNTIFKQVNLESVDFYCCSFYRCKSYNSSFESTRFFETHRFLIDFYNYDRYSFSRNTVFHCSKISSENSWWCQQDFEFRGITFSRLSTIYMEIGHADLAGEYYYLAKKNEGMSYEGLDRGLSMITNALCGYGERPSHTFICIVLNILLFGLFYLFSGFAINETSINLSEVQVTWPNIIKLFKLYCHSVFFSVTTFSTVGYGNYIPVGAISSTLSAIQMLTGVSLTALWTGCIFRKISR